MYLWRNWRWLPCNCRTWAFETASVNTCIPTRLFVLVFQTTAEQVGCTRLQWNRTGNTCMCWRWYKMASAEYTNFCSSKQNSIHAKSNGKTQEEWRAYWSTCFKTPHSYECNSFLFCLSWSSSVKDGQLSKIRAALMPELLLFEIFFSELPFSFPALPQGCPSWGKPYLVMFRGCHAPSKSTAQPRSHAAKLAIAQACQSHSILSTSRHCLPKRTSVWYLHAPSLACRRHRWLFREVWHETELCIGQPILKIHWCMPVA